jgi:ribulose-phosphate 3-epimerase
MQIALGIKSDPIQYRCSYEWLFRLMDRHSIHYMQLGSFFELYQLPDSWFTELRDQAASHGVRITSVFTAHRELGGFFTGDPRFEQVARRNYERLLEVAALLGADYAGSNPGAVYRDQPAAKADGITRYLGHMRQLASRAHALGLKGLTIEPMSCLAEPPSTPDEMRSMMQHLDAWHKSRPDSTVPVWLCGDVSHGLADADQQVVHGNLELFEYALPWMCEFHFKNTDAIFGSTFGFSPAERQRGTVDVAAVLAIARRRQADWPVDQVVDQMVGYLEISGPKLGRDYADPLLEGQLTESLAWLRHCIDGQA